MSPEFDFYHFQKSRFLRIGFLEYAHDMFINGHSEDYKSTYNYQTLLLMYWTLNYDRISNISRITHYRTINSDFIFLFFVRMGKAHIHICFHNIIDMHIKLLLPLDFA